MWFSIHTRARRKEKIPPLNRFRGRVSWQMIKRILIPDKHILFLTKATTLNKDFKNYFSQIKSKSINLSEHHLWIEIRNSPPTRMVNSDNHWRARAHTHTFSTDNLRSQMHKFCRVFLKEWVFQLKVARAGESLRGWTKSCRIQDQSSRISCHRRREREWRPKKQRKGFGALENDATD